MCLPDWLVKGWTEIDNRYVLCILYLGVFEVMIDTSYEESNALIFIIVKFDYQKQLGTNT